MTIFKWGLALLVGGFLLFFGFMKFSGAAFIFPYIEYRATAAGLPFANLAWPLGNYAVGAVEILAGALVLAPQTRRLGALVAVAPFLGAVLVHLSPYLGVVTPADFASPKPEAALAAGEGFVRAHFTAEESPTLFAIAAGMLLVSLANLFVQRRV